MTRCLGAYLSMISATVCNDGTLSPRSNVLAHSIICPSEFESSHLLKKFGEEEQEGERE